MATLNTMERRVAATWWARLESHLRAESAYLLPLRLFIGIGWLRSAVEKLVAVEWFHGAALSNYLTGQIESGSIAFPFYGDLVANLFLPHAALLSWIIIVGELLAGVAILAGALTPLALVGGLFMNLNFVLSGSVNPSAFYIVIQLALLLGGAGTVLSVDRWLEGRGIPSAGRGFVWLFAVLAALSALAALAVVPYIRSFGPDSVEDPAMLLLVLGALAALSFAITAVRRRPAGPPEPRRRGAAAARVSIQSQQALHIL